MSRRWSRRSRGREKRQEGLGEGPGDAESAARGGTRGHDLFRRRHALAARAGTKSAGSSAPAGQLSRSPATRDHPRGQPRKRGRARLAGFRAAGVNRLSFGVQSFRDPELRRLSRLHTADRARAAVAEARAAGFDNLSLDLMMWLPGAAGPEWLESVDAAIALESGPPVALSAGGVSECAAQGRDGARQLVPGARRRRGGDVL